MQHVGQITAEMLKESLPPEQYYQMVLDGAFGKHTSEGWHHWIGLCPFHNDSNAGSFFINKKTGGFNCFSCQACGGDIIAFHMHFKNVGFKQALNELAEVARCEK